MATDANRAARPVAAGVLARAWGDWRPSLALAIEAMILTRAIVWLAGIAAIHFAGLRADHRGFDPAYYTSPYGDLGNLLIGPAARWDAAWYLAIAHEGYGGSAAKAAFFPLYPLLARGVVGGIVLSLAAATIGLAALHRLARLELGEGPARAAVWLVATFPMAFFLSAVYSEALFLALSVGCVLCARTDRWLWAGLLGALGAATRSAGVLLVVPLALLWWAQRPPARRVRDLAAVAVVPLGLLAFLIGLAAGGHDMLGPFRTQEVWLRETGWPFAGVWDGAVAAWDGARQLLSGARSPVYFEQSGDDPFVTASHNLQLFAALALAIPPLIGALRRLPPAYFAYALAALALPLSTPVGPQPLMSLPRFLLVLFPLFMWLGWWATRGRARLPVLATIFMGLQALAVAEFATWHWVA